MIMLHNTCLTVNVDVSSYQWVTNSPYIIAFLRNFLPNLPYLAKIFTFYTKYLKMSLKCSKYRVKVFQNEIKFKF